MIVRTTIRPPMFGGMPPLVEWWWVEAPASLPLLTQLQGLPVSKFRYGIIETGRDLTPDELDRYSIEVVKPEDLQNPA